LTGQPKWSGVVADLLVVGGTAMTMAYDATTWATRDIDRNQRDIIRVVSAVDFSVLADRDCLVAFAAVVLCADRGVRAHKMGYDYGGIAHLTAKGAAGPHHQGRRW
jgi:hypothetical protein